MIYILFFIISAFFTYLVKINGAKWQLMDVPNGRSSHRVPIPRGGGIGFVLSSLAGLGYFYHEHFIDLSLLEILGLGSFLVAMVGFMDDIKNLPARYRLLFHSIMAVLLMVYVGIITDFDLGFTIIHWGLFGIVPTFLGLLWLTNFYNFMDGIDGFAALGGVTVFISLCLQLYLLYPASPLIPVCALFMVTLLGFLGWNWPRAKVFMGDVGSHFLGFSLAALLLLSILQGPLTIWSWLITLGAFWVDATYTLFYRLFTGQKWYKAHRSHACQLLAQDLGNHYKVSFWAGMINLFWLLPFSLLSLFFTRFAVLWCIVALLPLLGICAYVGAGKVRLCNSAL